MRLVPRSIHGRLLALSAMAIAVALAVAAAAIGDVLGRFVTQGLDQRLDAELTLLATAVDAGKSIDRDRLAQVRGLLDGGPEWTWRIVGPRGTTGSADFPELPLAPRDTGPPAPPLERGDHPRPLDARHGRVHARTVTLATAAGPVVLTAAAPREVVERPIRAALVPLLAALAILGSALAAATLVQLRLGLRPLRALRDHVAAIRAGRTGAVPDDQPDELRPLAAELNALVADNAAALATARGSAANLAHALKTPVATLALAVAVPGRDPDGGLAAEVARIDAVIRHHLARACASVADTRAATPLAPALRDLVGAIERIHADGGVAVELAVPDLAVAIDRHDLDEIAGNLIENAVRHARARVAVTAAADGRRIRLTIADDGPGIAAADRARAVEPGRRLDERGDGHGFGLAIARDLAALHGGTLTLDAAPGGGLAVTVVLPLGHLVS